MTSVPPILTLAEPFAYHEANIGIKIMLEHMNTERTNEFDVSIVWETSKH